MDLENAPENTLAQQNLSPALNSPVEAPKRKRGRPRKQTLLVATGVSQTQPATLPQAETRPAVLENPSIPAPALLSKPAKKRVSKKKLSLTQFDKDALKLVRRGVASVGEISSKLGVGRPAVEQRLAEMERAGLLEKNGESGFFHITVKGYNEYSPDSLETTLEEKAGKRQQAARKKDEMKKTIAAVPPEQEVSAQATQLRQEKGEIIVLPENAFPATKASDLETQSLEQNQGAQKASEQEKVDLSELLARGAPKEGGQAPSSNFKQRRSEKTVAEITVTPKPDASAQGKQAETDKCVLCRTGFVLSVSGGNPKYGHCFCGAAYHQDCYQGVLEASGECIQCGKKLDTNFDKASLDEVRKIKDVFG